MRAKSQLLAAALVLGACHAPGAIPKSEPRPPDSELARKGKPCEVDELVEKIELARTKSSRKKSRDLEDKIRKVIESPRDALTLFPRKK